MLNTLPVGTLLRGNSYRIVRFINSGGFGCTYEAVHTLFNERVAIKEFYVKDFCNRDNVSGHITIGTLSKQPLVSKLHCKFLDEAQAQRTMHHPGIVRVVDVFEENGTAYYVMDYIDGMSLSEMVKEKGALPEKEALHYIRQAGEALSYVHSLNRLHLDVKPSNIMVDRSGRAVLIDFGSSKQYDEAGGENTSTLMGQTPGYASPEQSACSVTTFQPVSDVYSLGATLYKLLSGITPAECMLRVSGEALAPLPESVSPATRRAVEAAMRLSRSERPQSVAEFLQLLDMPVAQEPEPTFVPEAEPTLTAADGYTPGNSDGGNFNDTTVAFGQSEPYAAPDETPQPEPEKPVRRKSNKLWVIALLLVVVAGAAAAFFLMNRSGKDAAGDNQVTAAAGAATGTGEAAPEGGNVTTAAKSVPDGFTDMGLSVAWASENMPVYGSYYPIYADAMASGDAEKRVPTPEEFTELQEKCTWTWQDTPAGFKVTGPSGASIFLPASGCEAYVSTKNRSLKGKDAYGLYWTSKQDTIFTFDKAGSEPDKPDSDCGYSLRMVCCGQN